MSLTIFSHKYNSKERRSLRDIGRTILYFTFLFMNSFNIYQVSLDLKHYSKHTENFNNFGVAGRVRHKISL